MEINKKKVTKLTVTEINGLDPISIIVDEMSKGKGSIIITCYGKAWTAFWPAMGSDLIDFFCTSENQYLIGYLDPSLKREIVDYDKISDDINNDVDRETLMLYVDEVIEVYGTDWIFNLPTTSNYKYEYLSRICDAVKLALKGKTQ